MTGKVEWRIRTYRPDDVEALVSLFYETVHTVNAADYTPQQLAAWAPESGRKEREEKWRHSLGQNASFIAELNGKIVGFSDLQKDGYLDRLYVHKDHQRQGIAAALLKRIEEEAENLGLPKIRVDVSLTAKPFFEKNGYQTIRQQIIEREGIELINHKMVKNLR